MAASQINVASMMRRKRSPIGSRPFDARDDLVTQPRSWMLVRVDRVLEIRCRRRTDVTPLNDAIMRPQPANRTEIRSGK
jgi:hypothetical protein